MLIERDQLAQRRRRQAVQKNRIRRAVAFEQPMGHEPVGRSLRLDFLCSLAERQRLGLGEDIGQENVMVPAQRVQGLGEGDEVAGDEPRALMDQLIEGVLAVRSGLAPVDRSGVIVHRWPSSVTCLPLLSIVSCWR